jgi:hypothetical protein
MPWCCLFCHQVGESKPSRRPYCIGTRSCRFRPLAGENSTDDEHDGWPVLKILRATY